MKTFPFLLTLVFLVEVVVGQAPVLLNDFTTEGASSFRLDPEIEGLRTDNLLYFIAYTADEGDELYRTNGTEIGTQLLKDIRPGNAGSNIQFITAVGDKIYFTANDGEHGTELWTSQGTQTSTKMVADLREGSNGGVSPSPKAFVIFQDMLYFSGWNEGSGYELLKLDPTTDQITLVKDIYTGSNNNGFPFSSSPSKLTAADDFIYFEATTADIGRELWGTDGTNAGTRLIKDVREGVSSSQIFNIRTFNNNIACFTADDGVHGRELWISLGSPQATYLVDDITPGSEGTNIELLEVTSGGLYFLVRESFSSRVLWVTNGSIGNANRVPFSEEGFRVSGHIFYKDELYLRRSNGRLWRTNGVSDSLVQVSDKSIRESMAIYRDSLFFVSNAGESNGLWKTDGTEEGISLVKAITTRSFQGINNLYATPEQLYFLAETDSLGRELWTSNGSEEGTFLLVDSRPGPEDGFRRSDDIAFQSLANRLFFVGFDETHGRELWTSDGSPEGTALLKDINTQTEGIILRSNPIAYQGNTYFTTGEGLWKTDGSAEGTELLKVLNQSVGLNVLGDKLLFTAAAEGVNQTIWVSDGTEAGTQALLDSATAAPLRLQFQDNLPKIGNTMFFVGRDLENRRELWKTDGTPEGTVLVKNIHPTDDALVSNVFFSEDNYIIFNNELYFPADDGTLGQELWKSDGTEEGTVPVTDINPFGASFPRNFHEIDGNILFSADDGAGGRELWRTDGTPNGTELVKDINPNGNESGLRFSDFTEFNNLLYFSADDGVSGRELWKSDGTEEGTVLLKEFQEDGAFGAPDGFFTTDSMFYFIARDSVGSRIWKSDGTEAGTTLFLDLFSFNPYFLDGNGTLFFSADDKVNGTELWRTDGTVAGTKLVADIFEGINTSNPRALGYVNDVLYFLASDLEHGFEMRSLTPLETSISLAADLTEICNPEDSVNFTASIENAGKAPIINWLINGIVVESGNALAFKTNGLGNDDEVTAQVISNSSIWALEDSVLSTAITIQYAPLEPTITISGEQLTASEADAYRWYFNGQAIDKATRTITAEESGEYQVEVFNGAGCSFFSNKVNLEVCNAPIPVIQVSGSTLTVNASGAYQWFLNGNVLTDTTQRIEATEAGSYTVTVTDAQGCIATSEAVVYQITGLHDTRLATAVYLYPNPAHSFLRIDSELAEQVAVSVYTASGKLLHSGKLKPFASEHEINIAYFPKGLYFITLQSERGLHQQKFIKQ